MSNTVPTEMELPVIVAPNLTWREILKMLKPVVALLVIITALPSMIMAGGAFPSFNVVVAVALGIFLTSAAGSIINQVIDYDIDSRMERTSDRLIPTYRMNRGVALGIGVLLLVVGCWVLYRFTTPMAAAIALAGDLFYIFVYTLFLKRRTPQNIVIGGAAGAVGPLIGWAAISNDLSIIAWLMFLLIFLWTPPHFWALAIKYKDDYAAAKVPMMPVVRGDEVTKFQMFVYSVLLVPNVVALVWLAESNLLTQTILIVLTLRFSHLCFELWRKPHQDPMPVFQYSCIYLFAIFFGLAIEQFAALVM
jgi:protoheme IX farnesyltransferase